MYLERAFFLEFELGITNLIIVNYQNYGRGIYGSEI